ncbi:MAG: CHAD domain-containing protein [Planktomarina temperata]|nr:CHAD domain-containing protein [Planktomarina temperata]
MNIALDQGVIASRRRKVGSRTFNEIEIELIDRDIEKLLQFGFELNKTVNVKLNGYSKADYGYALASQSYAFRPVKWEKLSEEVSAKTGLKELLSIAFFQLLKNKPEQGHNRLKSIHQTRVATRRIPARSFPKNIHDLRIRTKKLRYMLEVFQQGRDFKEVRLIKEVKSLQGLLDNFNDLSKSLELLSTATPSEIPTNVNGKLRDIVSGEMDKLYNLATPKLKRVRAIIRQIQKSN